MTVPATPPSASVINFTEDAFLGGRLSLLQTATGYRAGVDAVLLAASVPASGGALLQVLDCGAGVGTVGLCVAARCPAARVTLVEREPALLELAGRNVTLNALADRVAIVPGDLARPAMHPDAPRLAPETFDHVLANPPFHDDVGSTPARDPLRSASHAMQTGALDDWLRFAVRMTKPSGRFTLIHKAAALPAILDAMQDRFGALAVTPVQPYADKPAIRVLVSGIKGSGTPLTLHPPLILHDPGGAFTPHVSRILREAAPLYAQT